MYLIDVNKLTQQFQNSYEIEAGLSDFQKMTATATKKKTWETET